MPRSYSGLPWKRSFRKLPPEIEAALVRCSIQTECVVGCAKLVTNDEIAAGEYQHLCIDSLEELRSEFDSFVPSPNVGPASYANAIPIERVDKTHGKQTRLVPGRAPTKGRFSFHPTMCRRQVWRRVFCAPAMSHIAFKRVDDGSSAGQARIYFQIQEPVKTADADCRANVLRCINLLQENVGKIGLSPIDQAEAESIRRLSEDIGWEVLPENERASAIARLVRRLPLGQGDRARQIEDRFEAIVSLGPKKILHGTRGFIGYFAVEFCDAFTIYENLEVDHAMYVLRSGAQELSRLTRSELRTRLGSDLERIVHSKGWRDRLERLVKQARGDQSPNKGDMI